MQKYLLSGEVSLLSLTDNGERLKNRKVFQYFIFQMERNHSSEHVGLHRS